MQLACLVLKSPAIMYPSRYHVLKAISYVLSAKQAATLDVMPVKLLPLCNETEAALPKMLEVTVWLASEFYMAQWHGTRQYITAQQ